MTFFHSAQSLKEQAGQLLKGISHESQDVRQHALIQLKTLLHHNQGMLHELIVASETVDPLISQIINAVSFLATWWVTRIFGPRVF